MRKILNTLVTFCLITLMASCGSKANQQSQSASSERTETVKVRTITKTTVSRKLDLSTTLQGYETMNIAPSMTGRIEHIFVEVGSRVKAGDILIRMDQNQYNTTKLTYSNLSKEFKRIEALYKSGTVSQQTYDQTKLSIDQTKESLEFLENNTFVKARISGVIAAKNYEDGELYGGNPILVLTQIHQLKAMVSIPESYFPLVRQRMQLKLFSEIYPDQSFPATIEIVYPTIDPATHNFQVKLKIPNQKELLRPGMFVRTTIELGEVEAFLVPYQAVLRLTGSNERYVFINENGVARRISVTLGQRFDEMIEIMTNGIKEGDELVTVGQAKLVDGVKLKIVE